MNTSNLKDTATTICGILLALSGAVFTLEKAGVELPASVNTAAIAVGALAGAIIAFLTGKNPDGTTKTAEQVAAQNPAK